MAIGMNVSTLFSPRLGNLTKSLLLAFVFVFLGACSTLSTNDNPSLQTSKDPYSGLNRSVYKFNAAVDKAVLKPVAKAYDKSVPKPAKKGVSNFFSNLGEPLNIVNNLLQGKFERALKSSYRFAVNSTVGLLGLIDVADKYEVEEAPEDLGQTLAAWGVKPGPYIMLPFLGPSNLRDTVGLAGTSYFYYPSAITDDATANLALSALSIVNGRASLLGADELLDQQLDPYAFLKIAAEKQRLDAIYDGNPPAAEEEDFDDF